MTQFTQTMWTWGELWAFTQISYVSKGIFRDHYRDSISEYPNPHEYKDNHHEGYEGHPNQHHQPGKFFEIVKLLFILSHDFFVWAEGEQIIIPRTLTSEVLAAIQSVRFIAQHIKDSDRDNEVSRLLRTSWGVGCQF